MVTVQIVSDKGKPLKLVKNLPVLLDFPGKGTKDVKVGDAKAKLAEMYPKFYVSRQKLSIIQSGKTLDDAMTLEQIGVQDGVTLFVKDLGPQVSWTTVFLVEYGGPMFIHPIFYHFPKLVYGKVVVHSQLQQLIYVMVMLHFAKRELETLLVHRFSHGTMPFRNLFRNSAHYHLLSGVALAWGIYGPGYSASAVKGTIKDDTRFLYSCVGVWVFAQLSNAHAHLTTAALRPPGTTTRGIPQGYMFNFVSFPNYFFEILSWSVVSTMTNSIAAHVFLAFSAFTMSQWAVKKHRNYKKEFGKAYPRGRKAIFPFIL